MAWLVARIDLDERAKDFQRIALQPGFPVLDRFSANAHLVHEWLGAFAGQSSWDEQTVQFLYRDNQDHRPPRRVAPALPSDLTGSLRKDVEAIRQKLRQAAPRTPSDRALLGILQQRFEAAVADEAAAGSLFKIHMGGRWRLVWCWGYDRRRPTAAPLRVCPNDECRLAFFDDEAAGHHCSRCQTRVGRRRGSRALAWVVLLIALSVSGWWGANRIGLLSASVNGEVVDGVTGAPIPNATIRNTTASGASPSEANTDVHGQFQISRAGQTREFEISAAGYQTLRWKRPSSGWGMRQRIPLMGAANLSGLVLEADSDRPIPFATIRRTGVDHAVTADDLGLFVWQHVPSGSIELVVSAEGYQSATITKSMSDGATDELMITLVGSAAAQGVVADAFNKQPVGNALVHVDGLLEEVRTNARGEFRLEQLPGRPLRFEVSAPGYFSRDFERQPADFSEKALKFLVRPELTPLFGRVTDAAGQPLDAATVTATEGDVSVVTTAEGRFEFSGLRQGEQTFTVEAEGYPALTTTITLPLANNKPAELVLQGSARLAGRVIDAVRRSPVADAEVRVADGRWKTTTAADGRFTLDGLPTGKAAVSVVGRGYRTVEVEQQLTATTDDVTYELRSGTVLSGKVTAKRTGQPLGGARIVVEGLLEPIVANAEGRFRLDDAVAGPVQLTAEADGYQSAMAAGETKTDEEASFEFALRGAASLTGQVSAADTNRPLPQATLLIEGWDESIKANASGEFTVDDLPAKTCKLTASAEGFANESAEIELRSDGVTPFRFRLNRPMTIDGIVVDAKSEQPVAGAKVALSDVAEPITSDAQGRFRFLTSPASHYEFAVAAAGYPPQTFIERLPEPTAAAKPLRLPLRRDSDEPATSEKPFVPPVPQLEPPARDEEPPPEGEEFGALRRRPSDPIGVNFFGAQVKAANVGFVVDFSGSMSGKRIERTKLELLESLIDMNSQQRFYVSAFNDGPINMLNGVTEPLRAAPVEKVRVWKWLKTIPANGGTVPEPSLLHVSKMDPEAIFLLSDGVFSEVQQSTFDEFKKHNNKVHTIAFEDESGRAELQRIANRTGGAYRFVPEAPIPEMRELILLTRLYDQLLGEFLDSSTSAMAAQDAHAALKEMCEGEDFGPRPGAADPERRRARVDWQRWWVENKLAPALRVKEEAKLKKNCTNRNLWWRWASVEALHQNGHTAPETYLPLIKDKETGVNQAARHILRELAEGDDHGPEAFADDDARRRAFADWSEWHMRRKYLAGFYCRTDSQLAAEFHSPDRTICRKALEEAERRARFSLPGALIECLTDGDEQIRQSARHALQKLSSEDFGPATGADLAAAKTAAQKWKEWHGGRAETEAQRQMTLAQSLEKKQNRDAAKQRYAEIVQKYPDTKVADQARARIIVLGGAP